MGRTSREKPARLAEKLVYIRKALNLSQDEMVYRLGLKYHPTREEISKYERGLRVPSLLTLLKYAKASNLIVDCLIDDEVDLPERLPASSKSVGIKKKTNTKTVPKNAAKHMHR